MRPIRRCAVGGVNLHAAIVLDVDLAAGLLDDAADHLAARSDQLANLVGRNLQAENARRVGRHRRREASPSTAFILSKICSRALRACSRRFGHDGMRHVRDLDVHLQRRDAVFRAGDLEIHVAVMIFRARDVGQNRVILAFEHQAHRDARYRSRQRHTGVHQRKRRAANRRHRARSVRFHDVAHDAHRVGERFVVRNHRRQRAFRQCSVADFATARAAHEARLRRR